MYIFIGQEVITAQILGYKIHDYETGKLFAYNNPSCEDTFMSTDNCRTSRIGHEKERKEEIEKMGGKSCSTESSLEGGGVFVKCCDVNAI